MQFSPGSGQEQGLVGMSNASSASGGSGISTDFLLAKVSQMTKPIVNGLGCIPSHRRHFSHMAKGQVIFFSYKGGCE